MLHTVVKKSTPEPDYLNLNLGPAIFQTVCPQELAWMLSLGRGTHSTVVRLLLAKCVGHFWGDPAMLGLKPSLLNAKLVLHPLNSRLSTNFLIIGYLGHALVAGSFLITSSVLLLMVCFLISHWVSFILLPGIPNKVINPGLLQEKSVFCLPELARYFLCPFFFLSVSTLKTTVTTMRGVGAIA